MKYNKTIACLAINLCFVFNVSAQKQSGITAIREVDLKKDLYELSSDHFKGREAGTLDELKSAMWLADKAKAAGMQPAGDDGTFFQFFSLIRRRVLPSSSVKIGDRSFKLWDEALITLIAPASVSAPVVFIGSESNSNLDGIDIKGKAVAIEVSKDDIDLDISLPHRRYLGYVSAKYAVRLLEKGAAAIIFIADDIGEDSWAENLPYLTRGLYDVEGGPNATVQPRTPYIWLHKKELEFIKKSGLTLSANIGVESFEYPSVNVVGKILGTDPKLKKEYVLFSGHIDHDGIRMAEGQDSIYNGADDNGSMCVAMLAVARAFKKQPSKRSTLFVFHGSEERGLLGSKWYSLRPTVSKESIVAVLNGDMIGRNNPDSSALLGSQKPHLNSKALVKMAMDANTEGPNFKLDTLWDKPEHPEVFYFRSDHLPYAREGIPSIFYTTMLHGEYHTPMDEASHIDYKKLTKMTQWIYRTGWKVANAPVKPALEADFNLER
ncbi:M28 family peptidase [Ferruginibacter sp. SUN002]|uniref:M28 family peptidase n=1 Tax=Ferruginibacter sp. SUN002 TaxID=2937789 RepID=UPI003D363C2C